MSQFNFKGDVQQITDRQLEFVAEILRNKNVREGSEVTMEPVGAVGDNYMANVKRIVVERQDGSTIKMIGKFAPTDEVLRMMASTQLMFNNEHVVYTEILPKFRQIQIDAGLKEDEFFRYAECYGSSQEAPHEVILLEDLKESQFETLDRFKSLSNDCVKSVLKNFAIFHSLSYVLKKHEPETFGAIKAKLLNLFADVLSENEQSKMYFMQLEMMAIELMDDKKYKEVLKGKVAQIMELAGKCEKVDRNSKHSIIRQGDGWTNNIMFRLENGLPQESVLIDYQMSVESSPVFDIMYMLFNSTDHQQRVQNYHDFIDYYHTELDKSLHNYGIKATLVYPRDQLDAHLKRYGKYAFATSVMISSIIIKKAEEAAKMMEMMKTNMDPSDPAFNQLFEIDPETLVLLKKKIEDLVDSFLEFGLL